KFTPRTNALANLSAFTMVTDGGSTSALGSNAFTWMARINLTAELTKTLAIQGVYSYRAAMKIERGEMAAQQSAAVVLRMKVQQNKGLLLLRVADPFEMVKFHVQA